MHYLSFLWRAIVNVVMWRWLFVPLPPSPPTGPVVWLSSYVLLTSLMSPCYQYSPVPTTRRGRSSLERVVCCLVYQMTKIIISDRLIWKFSMLMRNVDSGPAVSDRFLWQTVLTIIMYCVLVTVKLLCLLLKSRCVNDPTWAAWA